MCGLSSAALSNALVTQVSGAGLDSLNLSEHYGQSLAQMSPITICEAWKAHNIHVRKALFPQGSVLACGGVWQRL